MKNQIVLIKKAHICAFFKLKVDNTAEQYRKEKANTTANNEQVPNHMTKFQSATQIENHTK